MEENKLYKSKKVQILFFVISMAILITVYWIGVYSICTTKEQNRIEQQAIVKDNSTLLNIEEVVKKNSTISILGWAVRLNSMDVDIKLVLQSVDETEVKIFSTELKNKKDISDYFKVDELIAMYEFQTDIKEKNLTKDKCYEILLVLDYKEQEIEYSKKITTTRYLYNGELYKYNPQEFVPPIVTDDELIQVIQNGNILSYDVRKEVWIYEYEKQIYWIVNFGLFGAYENRPELPLMSTFLSIQKTSEGILQFIKNRNYEGYYIKEREYQIYSNDDLFVYSRPVELENIFGITTGIYHNDGENEGWIWDTFIQLDVKIE